MTNNISLIGVPSDTGASDRGATMGPESLRVAGISNTLNKLGLTVTDRGDLVGPKNPELSPVDGYRHLDENIIWSQKVQEAVYNEIKDGKLPIVMGGDHAMSIGSIAAVSRFCAEHNKKLCMIWIDAHSDFNTCDTSPSGNIHGMPVAIAAGYGPQELLNIGKTTPMLEAEDIYQVGIRSVDDAEKALVIEAGITVYDMRNIDEIGMRETMNNILNDIKDKDACIHVSFDVDSLDPTIAPGVATTIPGGLTYREAQLCMEMIHDSGRMISLDLMEINPTLDFRNKTAKIAIELTASLFGRQIFPPSTSKS